MDIYSDLERKYKQLSPKLTDGELLSIFPEAKDIIPEKFKEWHTKKEKIISIIKTDLEFLKERMKPENYWFGREVIKVWLGDEFLNIERHLVRLKRLLSVAEGRAPKGRFTEEQTQQALAVPIETLVHQSLRKSGKALIGLCPFHNEKHPSFYIYPESNSFYCYGCQKGGDVIQFIILSQNCSFTEAIDYLIGGK